MLNYGTWEGVLSVTIPSYPVHDTLPFRENEKTLFIIAIFLYISFS